MLTLGLLLIIPVLWPFIAKAIWKHEITWIELLSNVLIVVLFVSLAYAGGSHLKTWDTQVLNGSVKSKSSDKVSCSHSYPCRCRTESSGFGKNRTSHMVCDTCYSHPYDVDWTLHSDLGDISIDRIDSQGVLRPPRYESASIGDPVAKSSSFTNYVKGAPDSLFNSFIEKQALSKYINKVPGYPLRVYDYHYLDRVLTVGVNVPDIREWNLGLANILRDLGPQKHANVIVVFTNETSPSFASAVKAGWLGGKFNDVVVVLGTPSYPAIEWVQVFSWSDADLFKVELRDLIYDMKVIDKDAILKVIHDEVKTKFVKKHAEDFAYLEDEISPPDWLIVVLSILGAIGSIILSRFFATNDSKDRRSGY